MCEEKELLNPAAVRGRGTVSEAEEEGEGGNAETRTATQIPGLHRAS